MKAGFVQDQLVQMFRKNIACTLQKQSCYVSKVFGYYNFMTVLTMEISAMQC